PGVGGRMEPDGHERVLPSGSAGLAGTGRPHRRGVVLGLHVRVGRQSDGDLGQGAVDLPSRVTSRHAGRPLKPEAAEADDELDGPEPEHEPAALNQAKIDPVMALLSHTTGPIDRNVSYDSYDSGWAGVLPSPRRLPPPGGGTVAA